MTKAISTKVARKASSAASFREYKSQALPNVTKYNKRPNDTSNKRFPGPVRIQKWRPISAVKLDKDN